jgi:hypothetical protein
MIVRPTPARVPLMIAPASRWKRWSRRGRYCLAQSMAIIMRGAATSTGMAWLRYPKTCSLGGMMSARRWNRST